MAELWLKTMDLQLLSRGRVSVKYTVSKLFFNGFRVGWTSQTTVVQRRLVGNHSRTFWIARDSPVLDQSHSPIPGETKATIEFRLVILFRNSMYHGFFGVISIIFRKFQGCLLYFSWFFIADKLHVTPNSSRISQLAAQPGHLNGIYLVNTKPILGLELVRNAGVGTPLSVNSYEL